MLRDLGVGKDEVKELNQDFERATTELQSVYKGVHTQHQFVSDILI